MSLSAGSLNRRITIQSPSTVQDAYGQPSQEWVNVIDTWASIRAASGKEIYAASGFVSQLTHTISIRNNPALKISPAMRVAYRDRMFLIQAVSDPDENRVQIDLLCLEINGGD